jgi:hypothetical protein
LVNICEDCQKTVHNNSESHSRVTTGDESWVYATALKKATITMKESSQHHYTREGQIKVSSNVNSLLIVFFDTDGTVNQ